MLVSCTLICNSFIRPFFFLMYFVQRIDCLHENRMSLMSLSLEFCLQLLFGSRTNFKRIWSPGSSTNFFGHRIRIVVLFKPLLHIFISFSVSARNTLANSKISLFDKNSVGVFFLIIGGKESIALLIPRTFLGFAPKNLPAPNMRLDWILVPCSSRTLSLLVDKTIKIMCQYPEIIHNK